MYFYARKKDGLVKDAKLFSKQTTNRCLISVEVPDDYAFPDIDEGNRYSFSVTKKLQTAQMKERALVLDISKGSMTTELEGTEMLDKTKAQKKEAARQDIAKRLFDEDYDVLKAEFVAKCEEIDSKEAVEVVSR